MRPIFKMAAAAALAVGLAGENLRADTIDTIHAGSVVGQSVNANYTGGSFSNTTAGAFTGSSLQSNPSDTFDAYCVSLNLTITPPADLAVTVLTLNTLTGGAGTYFASTYWTADVGNRLAFLLNTHSGDTSTAGRTALQLAIWKTIDQAFNVTSNIGNANTPGSVANLLAAYTDWTTNGYDQSTVYNSNAKLFVTPKPNGTQYQNLIGLVPGKDDTHAVPEPSSIAIVLGLIGLGAAGRYRARRKTA